MTALSRRHLLAGALSLRAAGALSAAARAAGLPAGDYPSQVNAWTSQVDAALDAIEAAEVEMQAAAARFEALRPAMPSALFRTLDDRQLGIFGDPLREDGRVVQGHGGAPVMILSSWWLEDAIERLADYPHLVERIHPRLAVVAAYEDASARALDDSGMGAAEDAALRARVTLEALFDRMLDEAADLPGIVQPLARGIVAHASLGAGERGTAGSRWGVRLAERAAKGLG